MALYETVCIARQDMSADDVDKMTEKLEKIIIDGKGKILSKEYWGLRKLAHKVKKNNRGHYVLINIEADCQVISELNRVIKFNEDIIRSLTLNNDHGVKGKSELFVCEKAKDFKPGKTKKEESKKYDSIADQMQFDN